MSAVRSALAVGTGSVHLRASDAAFLDCDCDETYTDSAGYTVPVDDGDTVHLDLPLVWDRLTGWDLPASDFFSLAEPCPDCRAYGCDGRHP